MPTKEHRKDPETTKIFGRKKENNTVIQNSFDEIILQQNKKLSVEGETHQNINYEVDEDQLYEIDKTRIDEKE